MYLSYISSATLALGQQWKSIFACYPLLKAILYMKYAIKVCHQMKYAIQKLFQGAGQL